MTLTNSRRQRVSPKEQSQISCFPELFPTGEFGEYHDREGPLTSSEYVKSKTRTRATERRQSYVFYLHDQKVKRELKADITNLLNNTRHKDKSVKQLITRAESNDYELERNLSTMLRSVRGTKQFWQLKRTEVNAMIRDFGPPSLFLTFSCAEYNSTDISDELKLANSLPIHSNPNIPQLCCEAPITVTRQFDSTFQTFFLEVILKGECLGKVSNYYFKKEYQARGAPHYHVLLWIEGAPVIGVNPPEDVLFFTQNIITCNIPEKKTDPELHHLVTTY